VETNLPSGEIQQLLEETGRKAILRGHGTTQGMGKFRSSSLTVIIYFVISCGFISDGSPSHIGAAVSIMSGENNIQGVIRFVQVGKPLTSNHIITC
jgi:hypothetical protein